MKEITIKNLSKLISKVVGGEGKVKFDLTKPDGTYSKLMKNNRIKELGWTSKIDLEDGLKQTYDDFMKMLNKIILNFFKLNEIY